jgi:sulfite reductase alpha subunit-like flavoprotein
MQSPNGSSFGFSNTSPLMSGSVRSSKNFVRLRARYLSLHFGTPRLLKCEQEELYDYTTRVRRTIHEVLSEFRSVRVPRERIFDLFPPLRPREFSIASASRAHPREVHLCVAIVDYKTKLKAQRRGVGTSFLVSLPVGA